MSTTRVTAVCLVHQLRPEHTNPDGLTAIDKRPVDFDVPVGPYGLAGDLVKDSRHHGGIEQAVYAYADEDAAWWAGELAREITPGLFGENLRIAGLDLTGAEIGERWRVGGSGLELELTSPRIPCATFARRIGEEHWVKRFAGHGAPGGYFAVTGSGPVQVGDAVEVVHRPGHGVRLGAVFAAYYSKDRDPYARLLRAEQDGVLRLYEDLRAHAVAATAGRG